MKLKALLLPATLLVALASVSPALAQNRSESWEVGPYLTFHSFDDAIEIEDDEGLGFRVGYNFVPMHEVEFSYDAVDTQDDVFHQIDVDIDQFQVNYLFNFIFDRRQMVVPYFAAGLGTFRIGVREGGFSDSETDPSFDVGGGVRFFFGKQFNLRLDGRFNSFTGDNVVLNDLYFTNFQFSVGVGWVLGGR